MSQGGRANHTTAVVQTIQQTETLILIPSTVTANCNGGATRTVTNYPAGQTVTVTSVVVRTETDAQKTSYWQTTVTSQASCHYQSTSELHSQKSARPVVIGNLPLRCLKRPLLRITRRRCSSVGQPRSSDGCESCSCYCHCYRDYPHGHEYTNHQHSRRYLDRKR